MVLAAGTTARGVAVVLVALTLGATGCTPHASALPAGFPDLDSFTAVPADNYITLGAKGPKRFISFSTPYNIQCNFVAAIDSVPDGSTQGISCDGNVPGYSGGSTATESCAIGTVREWGSSGFRLDKELTNCPPPPFNSGTLLNVGQKVTYQNATCAVGGDGLVACLDISLGQHGFVLKPSGSLGF